jgi:hypothetical protein
MVRGTGSINSRFPWHIKPLADPKSPFNI